MRIWGLNQGQHCYNSFGECSIVVYATVWKAVDRRKGIMVRFLHSPPDLIRTNSVRLESFCLLSMDKQCSVCNKSKPVESFSWKIQKKNIRQHHCKACQRKYNSTHYSSNHDRYLGKALARNLDNKKFIYDLKDNKPCADCKVVHRYFALDYDHRDPKTKIADISQMYAWGREALLREIAKCDLVCATCHRYRTFWRVNQSSALEPF